MRIGSLFSGIGGLELGLEWAGVGHTVWQVEQDPFCRSVLAHHWPDATRYTDVRDVGAHNLAPVDVICGGYPCQPFSVAGKRGGRADPRHLWPEFARIIGELRPRFAVLENVAAHLTLGFDRVLGDLAEIGYDAEWSTVRASDVGAPHRRERVFLVAYANGERESQRQRPVSDQRERTGDSGASLGGRRAGSGLEVRRTERGCECVGDADHKGPQRHGRSVGQCLPCRWHATGRHGASSGASLGWGDAVPVRGADGTVRLIPREAAEAGPESTVRALVDGLRPAMVGRGTHQGERGCLWPVVANVPGRVAKLRAIGNAVVPQCAYVVGQRLLAIHHEAEYSPDCENPCRLTP